MDLEYYFLFTVTLFQYGKTRETNCLNNLKISELLCLQHSVSLLSCSGKERPHSTVFISPEAINPTSAMNSINISATDTGPSALPLTIERSYPEPWQEKPTKLQTLFQVSITALAFLSFGGYLLCLIVQAIKSKGTTYFHPVATASTTSNNGQLKKIKIFRRTRRMANGTKGLKHGDDYTLAGPSPEDLYKTLLYFSEKYALNVGGKFK